MATFDSDMLDGAAGAALGAHALTVPASGVWTKDAMYAGGAAVFASASPNTAYSDSSSAAVYYAGGTPSGPDYSAFVRWTVRSGVGYSGLVINDDGAGNFYCAICDGTNFTIYRFGGAGGIGPLAQTGSAIGVGGSADAEFRRTTSGGNITLGLYLDGNPTPVLTATDTTALGPSGSGKAGLIFNGAMSSTTGVHVSSFSASDGSTGGGGGTPATLPALKIGVIGDSIEAGSVVGSGSAPVVEAASLLSTLHGTRTVTYSNQAVSGQRTDDWVSGSANLVAAKSAFVTAFGSASGVWVSLMLGTNDARIPSHNSKATFKSNLANICADLIGAGYAGVIVHYPPWASTSNSSIDAQAQTLLLSYLDAIDEIVAANPGRVFSGDDTAYLLFKNNPTWLSDGVHPDAAHSATLGDLQALAIYRATTAGLATSAGGAGGGGSLRLGL